MYVIKRESKSTLTHLNTKNFKKGIDTMEKTKKITKKDRYNELLAIKEVAENSALVDFINHELELLERKNSSGEKKPTATQTANAKIVEELYEEMEVGKKITLSDMLKTSEVCKTNGVESTQKLRPLMETLIKEGKVERTVDKRKIYFSKIG